MRAAAPGEGYVTAPHGHPGGASLLHISGWPRVDKVLLAIEIVEALGIDPADAAPDYWRHVHNRLSAGDRLTHRHDITPVAAQAGDAMTGGVIVLRTVAMAVAALRTTMDAGMTPRFVWNASASVPIGLYGVHPAQRTI